MTVPIKKLNENYVSVVCDKGIAKEIAEEFSFFVDGYRYMPQYKFGTWDGKINLFNLRNQTFPVGLILDLVRFLKSQSYSLEIDKTLRLWDFDQDLATFLDDVDEHLTLDPYDYQIEAFLKSVRLNRALVLSPTSSGKSLIIYLIIRFFLENVTGKILISVPSINLVQQLHSDFGDYDDDNVVYNECYELNSKASKQTTKRVIIATWSMIARQEMDWFSPFSVFIVDEAHQISSPILNKIVNQLNHVPFKFGFTGTLRGTKTHIMQCRAWLGSILQSSTTKELMDRGIVSKLKINCISLEHPQENRKLIKGLTYHDEIDFLINNKSRNDFLLSKALTMPGNTLVLFNQLKHGDILYRAAKDSDRKIHIITGEKTADEREAIRREMEERNDIVLFATYGTLSLGVSIHNLHYIIFSHPYKARIRNLQSIGRGLRLAENKECCTLIDIGDDLTIGRHQNHTFRHLIQRLRIYEEEGFDVTFQNMSLSGD